jgi:uncharacterized C2H2 Zn-finger protein
MDATHADQAFRDLVTSLHCPACNEPFTDAATNWGFAWHEGRIDALREEGVQERDGPFKVKCEWCGHRSLIDYFKNTATSAE